MSPRSPSIEFYETIVLKAQPNQNQTKKWIKRKELGKNDKKEDKKKKKGESFSWFISLVNIDFFPFGNMDNINIL